MIKHIINDKWHFYESNSSDRYEARVPGSQYTDLMANGIIPDPFDGENESKVAYVADKDYAYERATSLPADMKNKEHVFLHCDCIDTVADVYLDGQKVAYCRNAFVPLDVEVTGKIKDDSVLKIYFHSPAEYVREHNALDTMPHNFNGMSGTPHIRKPGCHFGWDWGPYLPTAGIASDIYLYAYDGARAKGMKITQTHSEGCVTVNVDYTLDGKPVKGATTVISLTDPDGKIIDSVSLPAEDETIAEFRVENPRLWWTNDLSDAKEQPLYTVKASLLQGKDSEDTVKKIGLRTVVLDRSPDKYGATFRFILNGVPLFIKGANYIPPDSLLTRVTEETHEYILKAMRRANMNMVRVWGGGRYETEDFYDICDREGILVWQDFMFACQPYPFYNNEFLSNVKEEIEYNVKRLSHRACLALWCGNNEIEVMSAAWMMFAKLREWTEKFFYRILPEELRKWDDVTSFIPGSPTGRGYMDGVTSDNYGDTHKWTVWHGLQPLSYYRKLFTRFCSEFGLESMPDMNTIASFCPPEQFDLKSPVMKAHQKCMSGNSKISYYVSTRFRLPAKFEDQVYLSQIVQSECVRDATEHWRRNRGRCNGSIYWQLNDCWPVLSWASMDYKGGYKALQYTARHFNNPILLSVEEDKNGAALHVINDTLYAFEGDITYEFLTFDGKKISGGGISGVTCAPASAKKITYLNLKKDLKKHRRHSVLKAVLRSKDGEIICTRTALFAPEKNLDLPEAKFTTDISVSGKTATITVKSDKYARYVRLFVNGVFAPFSDNYFDLTAGETKTVTLPLPSQMSAEEVKSAFTVTSIAGIKPAGSRLSECAFRWKVRLTPVNFFNWIGYHFM